MTKSKYKDKLRMACIKIRDDVLNEKLGKPFDFSSVRQKYVDNMIDLDKAKHYAISKEHGKLANTLSNLNKQDLESFCEWLFIQIK